MKITRDEAARAMLAALERLGSYEAFHLASWGEDLAHNQEVVARCDFARAAIAQAEAAGIKVGEAS